MLACEALGSVGQGPSCPGLLFDATRLSGHTRVPKRCCFPRPLKLDIACVIWGVWESRPPKVCLMAHTSLRVKTPKASGNQPTMFSTPGALPGLKGELRRETLAELRAGWDGKESFSSPYGTVAAPEQQGWAGRTGMLIWVTSASLGLPEATCDRAVCFLSTTKELQNGQGLAKEALKWHSVFPPGGYFELQVSWEQCW